MIRRGIVLQPENSIDVEPGAVTLLDQSRYRNHGAMANVTWIRLPSGLWVMEFAEGASSWVNFGTDPSVDITRRITVECWVNFEDLEGGVGARAILAKGTTSAEGYGLWLDRVNGAVDHWYFAGTGLTDPSSTPTDVSPGWHHLVGGYNGAAIYHYVDGVLADSDASTGTITPNANPLVMGNVAAVNRGITGMIGMVRILGYALTPGQILNNFEKTKHWFGIN